MQEKQIYSLGEERIGGKKIMLKLIIFEGIEKNYNRQVGQIRSQ